MKRLAFAVVALAAVGPIACLRQAAPERTADATPPPGVAGSVESSTPEGAATSSAEAPPAEAAPAAARPAAVPAAPPARRTSAPARPASAPAAPSDAERPAEPRASRVSEPPPPPPAPPRVLPSGTRIPLILRSTAASNTSEVEDRVLAEVAEDVTAEGRVVLPEGAEVIGHVIAAQPSGRVKGRARLAVRFQEVRVGGASYALETTDLDVTAASGKGRDAKVLGGAAAAGAIIGAIAGGGKGALKGGAIGGAAGGAAVLATKGKEVVFQTGEHYSIKLKTRLQVD
jgi:hypothetical protein